MQAIVNKGAFIGGLWVSLLVIYLTLGFFSSARRFEFKWGRGGIVPLSRLSRLLAVLTWALIAAACFASAFHYPEGKIGNIFVPAFLILFVLLLLSAFRDGRNFKKKEPHTH